MLKSKTVVLLDERDSPWYGFLGEYFEDSGSRLDYCYEALKMAPYLDQTPPHVVFIRNEAVTLGVAQKLKLLQQAYPGFRLFHLGEIKKPLSGITFDDVFLEPINISLFQKQMVAHLPLPEIIRMLVIDDEAEVGGMMGDFLEDRVSPSFEIHHESDGHKALKRIGKEHFDVIVLDVKMPAMSGCDIYKELKARNIQIPVIVYFDAIFGDEIIEIYKLGRPAVVEKGSRASMMPEMVALIKKMVYFG